MDQRSAPPYPTDQAKPPPYYPSQSTAAGGSFANTHTNPAETVWTPPPPPPYHTETEQFQGSRATVIAVTTTPTYITTEPQQTVLVLGNCPSCRVGFLRNEFNILGILLAFLFFPIGILCCLCMMDKRCSHCGARF